MMQQLAEADKPDARRRPRAGRRSGSDSATWRGKDAKEMTAARFNHLWVAPLLFTVWACGFLAIAITRVKQRREIRAPFWLSKHLVLAAAVPSLLVPVLTGAIEA